MAPDGAQNIESPVDIAQVTKALNALTKHINNEKVQRENVAAKKSLLADADADSDEIAEDVPIWLCLTLKTHIVDKKRLKPSKMYAFVLFLRWKLSAVTDYTGQHCPTRTVQ
jgi:ribosome biogenesis protein UTP30